MNEKDTLITYLKDNLPKNKEDITREITFKLIEEKISIDLKVKNEFIKFFPYLFWSDYVVNEGIKINSTLAKDEQTALLIHEYQHFRSVETASYFPFEKESIDDDVSNLISAISSFMEGKLDEELFSNETKSDEIFEKLFV